MSLVLEGAPMPVDAGSHLVVSEIKILHKEIVSICDEAVNAVRTSCLPKAIRLGQLLTEQKAALGHGEWLPWFDKNVDFSRATGERYRSVYENREKPRANSARLMNLADAYRLLNPPKQKKSLPPPTAAVEPKPDTEPPRKLTTKRAGDVKRISQSIHDALNQSLSRPDQIELMIDGVQRTLDEWKRRLTPTRSKYGVE